MPAAAALVKRECGRHTACVRTRPQLERYWTGALEKVRREGRCRLCPEVFDLQAAHTVARKHDEVFELEDGTLAIFVDPDDVIPLCPSCHAAYDARRVSILEVLTLGEQAAAVAHLGVVRALHRLTGQRMSVYNPLWQPPETRA